MQEELEQAEKRVKEIVDAAEKVVSKKLAPVNELIAEIKKAMSKGTDCITLAQLQEWAVAIPILSEELVPTREAYALTKNLWDIELKQLQAKNLMELDKKKTEIDLINKVAGTEHSKKSAIASFVAGNLAGTQETLWSLGNAVRKMIDARIAAGDVK